LRLNYTYHRPRDADYVASCRSLDRMKADFVRCYIGAALVLGCPIAGVVISAHA
jgi:hypothetical protein